MANQVKTMNFDTLPEVSELRESDILDESKLELMSNPAKGTEALYRMYCHSEQKTENHGFKFNTAEAMQTCTFISGSRGNGKSDIAMIIAGQLQSEGVIVICFDSSTDWLKRSGISRYVTVQPYSTLDVPEQSTIFDLSLLTPIQQQTAVENFNKKLFESQLNSEKRCYVVFEESQLYFPLNALRSKKCQNSARVLTVGRNVGISVCSISQFPALVDKELIKNAQQLYIGCTAEPNTLAYWRGILGNETDKLKELSNGQFLYYCRNKISEIEIQPYESTTAKTQIVHNATPTPQPQPITPQPKNNNTALLKFLVISGIGLLILLIGGM